MILVLLAALIVLVLVFSLIGFALWALVSVAIVGAIIGGLARLALPGQQQIGLGATILLGWIGSFIGSVIGYRMIHTGRIITVIIEVAVAAALIGIYSASPSRNLSARGWPSRR